MKRFAAFMLLLTLTACQGGQALPSSIPQPTPTPTAAPSPTPTPDPVAEQLASLSTKEKVGQLLMVGFEGTQAGEDALWALTQAKVGGVILFSRNVDSPSQLTALTNTLKEQNGSPIPLFLAVDEEGGAVSRMPKELADLPSPYQWTKAGGDGYSRGSLLAAQCAAFGFNVDFAPVLDVWSNPDNTVIGKRAFSSDSGIAAQMGSRAVQGLADGGVIPVGKHFPGHGDTAVDSHAGLPVVKKTPAQLEELELVPFRAAIEAGVPALMAGHILVEALDPALPASLSPKVIDGLLREELGFEGVVFTDDLTMGAIAQGYSVGEAAVLAIEAGCDVALVCHRLADQQEAYAALLEAAESGRISPGRLDESVTRILALKNAFALSDQAVALPDVEALDRAIRQVLP